MHAFFDRLKLATKVLVPIVGLAILSAGVVGLGIWRLKTISGDYAQMTERADRAMALALRANRVFQGFGYSLHVIIDLDADNPVSREAQKSIKAAVGQVDELFAEAAQLDASHAERFGHFQRKMVALMTASKPVVEAALLTPGVDHGVTLKPQDLAAMADVVKRATSIDVEIQNTLAESVDFNSVLLAETKARSEALSASATNAIWLMIGCSAAAIVVGLAISLYVSRNIIVRPILELAGHMTQAAKNDISFEVKGAHRADEIGAMARALQIFKNNAIAWQESDAKAAEGKRRAEEERKRAEEAAIASEREVVTKSFGAGLKRIAAKDLTYRMNDDLPTVYHGLRDDFNSAIEQLEGALDNVSEGAQAIGAATREVTVAADDLSKRTEKQAAALEEASAALQEIATTAKRSSDSAREVRTIVDTTHDEAVSSASIVERAVGAMNRIEKSSDDIGQIIGVIDEIAFQTNLLALNAGVEAARAGEAGRGFAVVATEVRALAQRSAQAAKEIKSLISGSAGEVEQGVELVRETGNALDRISSRIATINGLVSQIAEGAHEQSSAIEQINVAVSEMDRDTQKNVAMVEETTAASHSLRQEASELQSTVGVFATSAQSRRKGAPKSAAPRRELRHRASGGGNAARVAAAEPDVDQWDEF